MQFDHRYILYQTIKNISLLENNKDKEMKEMK